MKYDAVDAHAVVVVEQWLEHGRMFIPCTSYLCKSLCLYDVLAVDMCTADGVEHVVRLVVCGTVEPELTHRVIHMLIVHQSVTHHSGSHALCRELASVFLAQQAHLGEEDIVDKFGYCGANVT